MSKQTTAELIAEARQLTRHSSVSVPEHANMLGRLATALEAADQRAELAEANLAVEEDKNAGYRAKNNQLAAVVEKVRAADSASSSWDHFGHLVMDILATAPADALRELKANVWDEGAMWAAVECGAIRDGGSGFLTQGDNPYRPREEQS